MRQPSTLERSKVDLRSLRGKSIFMTGGTGFFGQGVLDLVNELNEGGYNVGVTLLSRDPDQFLKKNPGRKHQAIEFVKGEAANYVFPSQRFDCMLLGAADTSPAALQSPDRLKETIVGGTIHALNHADVAGARRMLLVSSGAVYGEVPEQMKFIPEDAPLNPGADAYGEAKREAEQTFLRASLNAERVIARCFAFMGPGLAQHLALSELIRQAKEEPEMTIRGSGKPRRSFLHGNDLAVWLLKLLADGTPGEVFNVGSDQPMTILALAEKIRDILAPGKSIRVLGAQGPEKRFNYVPSVDKARTLGLNVWTTLEETLEAMKAN